MRTSESILLAVGIFVGMIGLLELGRRLGGARQAADDGKRAGLGSIEAAIFGLMGLLIAFTFSGAASRYEQRRQLIVDEANAIGTAWLRVDLAPPAAQAGLHDLLRRYLDERLATYARWQDVEAVQTSLDRTAAAQAELWAQATSACRERPDAVTAQLVPALNDVFDIATTRTMYREAHTPVVVYLVLAVLAFASALLAGIAVAGASRSWVHMIGFPLLLSITIYVILDLEYPRVGLLRLDATEQLLVDLRQSMG